MYSDPPVKSSVPGLPGALGQAGRGGSVPQRTSASHVIPAEHVPESAGTVSFFGNQERKGDWLLPRLFRAVAFMGSVTIDLTRARMGPGTSEIELRAVLGNIEIHVPPELRVESDVAAIMGNFETDTKVETVTDPSAPLIRIHGTAFMANVEVKVIDPNAPGWLQRLAAKLG